MKKILTLLFLFHLIFVSVVASETLDEAVLRSGGVIGSVDISNTLTPGETYIISWMVQSYVDIRSRFQIIYSDNIAETIEGHRDDKKIGRYSISDRKSYEYYFSIQYTVPYGKTGDARVGFHNSQNDGDWWMYSLFPRGVISRPYGTAGKQFFVTVDYKSKLTDDELLIQFSPVMAFHAGDYLPSPIEAFINYSVLYSYDDEAIAYGQKLPNKLGYWEGLFFPEYIIFDISDNKMSLTNFPDELSSGDGYYLDILNETFWQPSGKDTNSGFGDSQMKEVAFWPYEIMKDSEKIVYGRVKKQSGKTYLQYHFFYLINEWNRNGGGNDIIDDFGFHEGDWEGMIIELDEDQNPLRATVSIHVRKAGFKGGETRTWMDVQKIGNNPVVYVGKGGHPTYFNKGKTEVYFGVVGIDDHSGSDEILRNSNKIDTSSINSSVDPTLYQIINIEENSYVKKWLESQVVWGKDWNDVAEKAVKAPKFFDPDRWDNPKKWMDDRE